MVKIPFPGLSSPGKFNESGGRLVNLYPERLNDGRIALKTAPGLRQIADAGAFVGCRGMIDISGTLLAVIGTRVVTVTRSGTGVYTLTDIGELSGAGPVYFARNNKVSPDIAGVTGSTAYLFTLSSAPTLYTGADPDVGSPNSVCSQGGYFVFSYGDGKVQASGLNATSINTLDDAFAEARPDGGLRVIPMGEHIVIFGAETTEIWKNTGEPTGFPYSRAQVISTGIAGADAVAGWDAGFPEGGICFVGSDNVVYRIQGYQTQAIGNNVVARAIAGVADKSRLEASVFMHAGHPIWVLSAPEFTWCYDISTGAWFERKSGTAGRWRAQRMALTFGGREWVCGSALSGKVFALSDTLRQEGDDPIQIEATSATVTSMPQRVRVAEAAIHCMVGVGVAFGNEPEANPHVRVSWSHNGGVTFSNPLLIPIGAQGAYEQRVRALRLGLMGDQGMQIRVQYSGKTDFALYGGELITGRT
jgi:hypothetical protein